MGGGGQGAVGSAEFAATSKGGLTGRNISPVSKERDAIAPLTVSGYRYIRNFKYIPNTLTTIVIERESFFYFCPVQSNYLSTSEVYVCIPSIIQLQLNLYFVFRLTRPMSYSTTLVCGLG